MNKLFICQTFHWDLGLLSRPKYIYVWQVVLSSTPCTWIKNTLRYKYEIICFIFSLTSDSTTFFYILPYRNWLCLSVHNFISNRSRRCALVFPKRNGLSRHCFVSCRCRCRCRWMLKIVYRKVEIWSLGITIFRNSLMWGDKLYFY